MKTKEQIEQELEYRKNLTKYKTYEEKHSNSNMIQVLKWVLNMPTTIKTHCEKKEKK